jgi:hypothetical protein
MTSGARVRDDARAVVTVRFTLSKAEAFACQRRVQLRHRSTWIYISVGAVIAIVGVVLAIGEVAAFGAIFAVGFLADGLLIKPGVVWRRQPAMRTEQAITVSDSGVGLELAGVKSRTEWSYWSRAGLVGDAYVIFGRQRGFAQIPRRAFGSPADEQRFRELLTAHLGAAFPPLAATA